MDDDARRLLHQNVAPHYADGQVLTLGAVTPLEDLSGESTADLVVTLAHNLDAMAKPDVFDFTGYARKVAALWRELSFRGVTLT